MRSCAFPFHNVQGKSSRCLAPPVLFDAPGITALCITTYHSCLLDSSAVPQPFYCPAQNYQMVLFDTPGIIERKRTKLEERMMAAVVNSIQNSEAIIAVGCQRS